jgi:hypothetical protein
MKYCTAFAFLLLFCSCEKFNYPDPLLATNDVTGYIHIVYDDRKTGIPEPWLFEFGNATNASYNLTMPGAMIWPRVAGAQLVTSPGGHKMYYLGGIPLIELDSLIQVMPSQNLPDTNYKHYVFGINHQLLDKPVFKLMLDGAKYGIIRTRKEYVTVCLSTNDTLLSRAVEGCNAQLADSILSQKGFEGIH